MPDYIKHCIRDAGYKIAKSKRAISGTAKVNQLNIVEDKGSGLARSEKTQLGLTVFSSMQKITVFRMHFNHYLISNIKIFYA